MNRRHCAILSMLCSVLLAACGGEVAGDAGDAGGANDDAGDASTVLPDAAATSDGALPPDGGARDASDGGTTDAGNPWFYPYDKVDVPSLFTANAVGLGDVNGDGTVDAVVTALWWDTTNMNTAPVRALLVFAGDGHGGFAQPTMTTIQPYGDPPRVIVVGDVTGDGKSDVVVGIETNLVVYPQVAGAFGAPVSYRSPQNQLVGAIVLADVDGDGVDEIVARAGGSANVYRRDGNGGLVLARTSTFAAGAIGGFAVGALGASVAPDLVGTVGLGLGHGSQIAIAAQTSDGGFGASTTYDVDLTESANRLAVGDVDGDGLADVVVTVGGNRPSSKLAVLTQHGGILRAARELPSYDIPQAIHVADVDGDGRKDVVVLHTTWQAIGVYVQTSTGALAAEALVDFDYIQGDDMAVGDVDGDGRVDIVAATGSGLVVLRHLP